jgi:hypothetical protein
VAVLKSGPARCGRTVPGRRTAGIARAGSREGTPRTSRGSRLVRNLVLVALLVCSISQADETLRCGSRIVALGQTRLAVQTVCSEPSLVDLWPEASPPFGRGRGPVEVWTYNFGPNRLLWLLRFDGDRLSTLETEGYGFFVVPDRHCEPHEIAVGMSKYRLLAYCGEPASRRARDVLEPDRPRTLAANGLSAFVPGGAYRASYREEWTYNFGSARLMRKILIDNGRIVDVQDGERGFDIP